MRYLLLCAPRRFQSARVRLSVLGVLILAIGFYAQIFHILSSRATDNPKKRYVYPLYRDTAEKISENSNNRSTRYNDINLQENVELFKITEGTTSIKHTSRTNALIETPVEAVNINNMSQRNVQIETPVEAVNINNISQRNVQIETPVEAVNINNISQRNVQIETPVEAVNINNISQRNVQIETPVEAVNINNISQRNVQIETLVEAVNINNMSQRNVQIETAMEADSNKNMLHRDELPWKHRDQNNIHYKMLTGGMIDVLCDMYRREVITGSMCDQLCSFNTLRAIQQRDIGDSTGKRVYMLNCTGCVPDSNITSVIMKLFLTPTWENKANEEIQTFNSLELYEEYLNSKIIKSAKKHYGNILPNVSNVLSIMWGGPLDSKVSKNDRMKVLRSISGLLGEDTDQEYLSLRLLQRAPFIPRLYGTCGPAYFLEFAPTLRDLGYLYSWKRPFTGPKLSWKRRVEVTLKLLQWTKDMDNVFGERLILCDVRRSNLGLTKNNQVVIIDLDDLKYDGDFSRNFVLHHFAENCRADNNCDFNACKGTCNFPTRTCGNAWLNNNLQRICAHLLITRPKQLYGILWDPPPTVPNLLTVLDTCKQLSSRHGEEQLRINSQEIYTQLKEMLIKSISS